MITHLRGKVFDIGENYIVLDINNIGYKVIMPTIELVGIKQDKEMLVYTYMNVKEDAIELYGSTDEKVINLFKKLIEVSGIGPKVAMGILSKMNAGDLISAIVNSDVSTISTCPGIGKKTSERLVLELRDKLIKQNIDGGVTIGMKKIESSDVKDECIEALVNLGYKRSDSKRIVDKSYKNGMSLEELIKVALTK